MPLIDIQWSWIAPELVLAGFALAALLAAVIGAAARGRGASAKAAMGPEGGPGLRLAAALSMAGVALSAILTLPQLAAGSERLHFWGGMAHDPFSAFLKVMVALSVLVVMVMLGGYWRALHNRPEIYALLALATLAIYFMASAAELVLLALAIEFLSLTSYVLVGYLKHEPRSAEAGLKYFLFGALCSAVMLYGMSLLYGLTGSTTLQGIGAAISGPAAGTRPEILLAAILLVLAGLGFKIAMVPFHQWVPDAYEGAPTPITAFLSVASKAAGFAVAIRFFAMAFPVEEIAHHWATIVAILAMLTMTWGNTVAIWQTNMKRMLAYSSIAQAGYVMVGLAALGIGGRAVEAYAIPGILLYLAVYLFMNLGAFAVVIAVANRGGTEEIPGYAGLHHRAPWLAAVLTLFLLSLIGIPPTAGFVGKVWLFLAAIRGNSVLLAVLAVVLFINSVISAYYDLGVVRRMYLEAPEDSTPLSTNRPLVGALAVCAIATLVIGLYGQPLFALAQETAATSTLLHGVTLWQSAGR